MGQKSSLIIPGQQDIAAFADPENGKIVTVEQLEPVFFDLLMQASRVHKSGISDFAISYMAQMMAVFADPKEVFIYNKDGTRLQPLAFIYAQAVDKTGSERVSALRKLGDTALYRAGFMAESFKRQMVGVDYCIDMGIAAYQSVSTMLDEDVTEPGHGLFCELSVKFTACVDLLSEVDGKTNPGSNSDILELYEQWLKTGSEKTAKHLREQGINIPANVRPTINTRPN